MPVFHSVKVRLQFLIVVLLGAVVAGLAWSTYRHLTQTLQQTAAARLVSANARITGMLQESVARVRADAKAVANDPALARAITRPDAANLAAARAVLARARAQASESLSRALWTRECRLMLTTAARSAVTPTADECPGVRAGANNFARLRDPSGWVQPFVRHGDTVRYKVVSLVVSAAGDTIGSVVETHTLKANESAKVAASLIGADVAIMLGNSVGPALWTDLSGLVDGPSAAVSRGPAAQYLDTDGRLQLGVARDLALTPWTVWVQVPHDSVVAPATDTMRELGIIALLCLAAGVVGAWMISRHVTNPISEVAEAAEDLAAGNYSRRVVTRRRDEIGRLVASFNRMAAEVERASADLQSQAVELELHAEQAQDLAHELELSNQELSDALEEATSARQESTQAESLLDEVLVQAPIGIAVFDRDMRYVRLNQAVADLHEVPLQEHYGRRPSDVEPLLGQLAEPLLQAVLHTGEKILDRRLTITLRNGARRTWLATCFPIRGHDTEVTGVGAILVDTTVQQELEAQLLQAQKMEAVGRLAGGVAHDFNNLLTVITSYSTMALGTLDANDPLHGDMCEIRGAAERAARLTRQLLAFSRKQVMRPQELDLSRMASEMKAMLERLIGEDVALELVLDPDLGIISADPGQIEQVIMNLVVNARDAMPTGGHLAIETSNVDFSTELSMTELGRPAGAYVLLSVTDTGTGMSEETQARLFEPFFTTKAPGRGTGLGLSTVYGIVKQSGGDIHVRSEPGRGTSFRIYFPRIEASERAEVPRIPARNSPPHGSETILLVEDDVALRTLAARVLRDAGYTVLETETPAGAILLGTNHEGDIDLLLTDVVMPQMSGRIVAELLSSQRPALKVLYMSGYTDDDVVRRGVLTTEMAFLQKPFTPPELLEHIRSALDSRAAQSS